MKTLRITLWTALAFVFTTQIAIAHTHLASSIPANGSKLSVAPKEISLSFMAEVQLTAVSVESPGGKKESLKPLPTAKVKQATLPLPVLAAGAHTVNWRALGADGHVMSGKITFTISTVK